MTKQDRFRGCLLGLACGDAVGTAVEFSARGSFQPVTGMTGGGPFNLKPGEWTDDTSMALCLATSLVEKHAFDPHDQMERYGRWHDEGYLSSNGRCFDIGMTISNALGRFKETGDPFSGPTNPRSAGNGCIMRLAPVPMFFHPDLEEVTYYSGESSRTTHGARECIDACRLFGAMISQALAGKTKDEILFSGYDDKHSLSPKIQEIAQGRYREKSEDKISGSGYVVACLEAALWSFYHTANFRDAVLRAVNLGDDADTTGAVCGQIAGAFYGASAIPQEWLDILAKYDLIVELAEKLLTRGG